MTQTLYALGYKPALLDTGFGLKKGCALESELLTPIAPCLALGRGRLGMTTVPYQIPLTNAKQGLLCARQPCHTVVGCDVVLKIAPYKDPTMTP